MAPAHAAGGPETTCAKAGRRLRPLTAALALCLALAQPVAVLAQPQAGWRVVRAPIVHNWQDPGGRLSVQTAYGNHYVPDASELPPGQPAEASRALAKVLLRCSSGAPVTLYVSPEDPERIVGIEDFEGRTWLAAPDVPAAKAGP